MALQNLSQPEYQPEPVPPEGSLPGLSAMVRSFLGLVQPNAFPAELLTNLVQQKVEITQPVVYKEVLLYEVGFLVCTAIGLLFILLVPLVGLCFCCCRCCGNCGGTMYQKQGKRTGCRRRALFVSVLLVTVLILAGNICAFISNNRMSRAVNSSFGTFNTTLGNLRTFLGAVPQQVDLVIAASDQPIGEANRSLQTIGPILGGRIVSKLGEEAYGALGSAVSLLEVTDLVQSELLAVKDSAQGLQQLQRTLSQNLSDLQKQINQTLQSCGPPCSQVSISGLAFAADFGMVPDTSSQLELLGNLSSANLSATLQQANETLHETPRRVEEQAQPVVSDAQAQLGKVRGEIRGARSKITALASLGNVSASLESLGGQARHYEPQVAAHDGYRWAVGTCLCCLVLLVVLCNLLGLLLGAVGLRPSALPIERGCLSNAGGDFFMAGVGFSFLFSWLLMLVVLLTFLLGGNTQTLACRPWHSQQLLRFLDTPGLIPSFNLSEMLGLQGGTVTLSGVYNDCQHDQPLWSALQLGQAVSLDEILNISQYTSEITTAFERLNVSLAPVTFLSQRQRQLLQDVGASGLQPNFTGTLQQLERNLTHQDLPALAAQLEALADQTDDASRKQDLQDEAAALRQINGQIESSFRPEMQTLNRSIRTVQATTPQVPSRVDETLQRIAAAQTLLDAGAAGIVRNESWAFLQELLGAFESYVAWAKSTLTGEVGRCGPAAKSLDVAATVVCSYVVDSLNGFWFSLGWCTVFLLPSIVLSVRLAKFYRRMKIADIYESNEEAMEMSSTTTLFKIPRVGMSD